MFESNSDEEVEEVVKNNEEGDEKCRVVDSIFPLLVNGVCTPTNNVEELRSHCVCCFGRRD